MHGADGQQQRHGSQPLIRLNSDHADVERPVAFINGDRNATFGTRARECGAMDNQNFGKEFFTGPSIRPSMASGSVRTRWASVQQEGAGAGGFRRWFGTYTLDNTLASASRRRSLGSAAARRRRSASARWQSRRPLTISTSWQE
jgi:hypothetical protein